LYFSRIVLVGIRRITEDLSVGVLDLTAFSAVAGCRGKRETEKAGARFLISKMLENEPVIIGYSNENKPFLEKRHEHISISHSHDRLAVSVNNRESTGIDIELVRDKVKNVAHKFMNAQEAEFAGEDVEKMMMIWAAKESLYKAAGGWGTNFREHLSVEPAGENLLKGTIRRGKSPVEYLLFHKKMDDYMLVFTLHEI
jgi:4'-phosphopantetheinyl transferase